MSLIREIKFPAYLCANFVKNTGDGAAAFTPGRSPSLACRRGCLGSPRGCQSSTVSENPQLKLHFGTVRQLEGRRESSCILRPATQRRN
jgi:hypothetical protein